MDFAALVADYIANYQDRAQRGLRYYVIQRSLKSTANPCMFSKPPMRLTLVLVEPETEWKDGGDLADRISQWTKERGKSPGRRVGRGAHLLTGGPLRITGRGPAGARKRRVPPFTPM